jgi:hypothetical protein
MSDKAIKVVLGANDSHLQVTERRTDPRHSFTATVEAFDTVAKLRVKGRTSDLSRGGCYVDTISPFGIGTLAKVRITRDNKTFDVEARVVYSQASMGMGLMFTALLPEKSGVIDRWIGEVTGAILEDSDAGFAPEQSEAGASELRDERQFVLNELVISLMRKGVLPESEGKAMLKKLHR